MYAMLWAAIRYSMWIWNGSASSVPLSDNSGGGGWRTGIENAVLIVGMDYYHHHWYGESRTNDGRLILVFKLLFYKLAT